MQLGHDEREQQLALLQAQIEPHFLFNVLGNVRRLYRTQPQAGSETIASLMRYLRAALPQLRSQSASLGAELELVRAYLDLLQVRMGARLTFSIEADPTAARRGISTDAAHHARGKRHQARTRAGRAAAASACASAVTATFGSRCTR